MNRNQPQFRYRTRCILFPALALRFGTNGMVIHRALLAPLASALYRLP
ncbi:MAG: hypothetical protein LV471_04495 [Nitrosomonas sp.]|nr:hypothetical protein [Nitrosomonas sp.]